MDAFPNNQVQQSVQREMSSLSSMPMAFVLHVHLSTMQAVLCTLQFIIKLSHVTYWNQVERVSGKQFLSFGTIQWPLFISSTFFQRDIAHQFSRIALSDIVYFSCSLSLSVRSLHDAVQLCRFCFCFFSPSASHINGRWTRYRVLGGCLCVSALACAGCAVPHPSVPEHARAPPRPRAQEEPLDESGGKLRKLTETIWMIC